jgi:hypothetical protein
MAPQLATERVDDISISYNISLPKRMLGDQLASMSVAENASGFSEGAGRFHEKKG